MRRSLSRVREAYRAGWHAVRCTDFDKNEFSSALELEIMRGFHGIETTCAYYSLLDRREADQRAWEAGLYWEKPKGIQRG